LTSILKVNDEGEKEKTSPDADEMTETESTDSSSGDSYAEQRKRAQIFRVERMSWDEPIGLELSAGKGGMVVTEIKVNSPFRFTGLNRGMRILEINGVLCPGSLVVAENLLRGAEGDIELVVTNEEKGASVTPVLFYSDY
jgi:C-terminal processing protease CtpA/Prc